MNLPRQMLVYHLLRIGKFMRGRVGVGGRSPAGFSPSPQPSPPIHLPAKSSTVHTFLAASVRGRGPNCATLKVGALNQPLNRATAQPTSTSRFPFGKNDFQLSYLGLPSLTVRRGLWLGLAGSRIKFMRASCGVRPPFFVLHFTQDATTFSQVVSPPRLRGTTWSRLSWLAGRV
jgi:hypothetical protein